MTKGCYWVFASPRKIFNVACDYELMVEQINSKSSSLLIDRFTGNIEISAYFKPRNNIQHVVFDFDGTIADSMRWYWQNYEIVIKNEAGKAKKVRLRSGAP